jgi:hypothetical protein
MCQAAAHKAKLTCSLRVGLDGRERLVVSSGSGVVRPRFTPPTAAARWPFFGFVFLAARPLMAAGEINYQVSDSGCVVTVRDTGVASLAPRTRIRETDSAHGGRLTLNVASPSHFTWLLIAPRHNT